MRKLFLTLVVSLTLVRIASAQTPAKDLYTAVLKNKSAEVEALLTSGADANASVEMVPGFPTTYLIIAAGQNHLDIVKSLLQHKASVNKADNFRNTPLMAAAAKGHVQVVQLLLASGADAKMQDDDGKNALAFAKEGNHAAVVALLEPKTK